MIISDPYSRYTRPTDDSGVNQIVNYSPIHLSTRCIMYSGKYIIYFISFQLMSKYNISGNSVVCPR